MGAHCENALLNTGIYGVPEAARLTGVSPGRIRRWIKGYDFRTGDERRHSDAVWTGSISTVDGKVALGFLDLMEVRFVDEFLRAGVSWKTMRKAHLLARQEIENGHPFCTNRFVSDGRRILLKHATEAADEALMDIVSSQVEFQRIVAPFLKQLDFAQDALARWWPMGRDRTVVVDPGRNLGQPTVAKSGVPTEVLARSVHANESVETVARWYEVLPEEVRDAMEFEQSLAA
jgi:uncharacterized protein (DUF433 family)